MKIQVSEHVAACKQCRESLSALCPEGIRIMNNLSDDLCFSRQTMRDAQLMKMGKGSKISPRASIYNPGNIEVGNNVRIDDYVVLSGGSGLRIGSHIHIACFSAFYAGAGIVIEDFAQFSVRISIFSVSDDFCGESLVGPQIPAKFKPNIRPGKVLVKRHVLFGANCTVLPGVTIGEGTAIGAHSLIITDCEPWSIYAGVPAKKIGERSRKILELEKEFLEEYGRSND